MLYKIILILILTIISPVYPLIILIHGSFAKNSNWHQPGGIFFETLKKHNHQTVLSFQWSGKPLTSEITKAAKELAYFIATYPHKNEEITLIGHSHGGNVITKATQFLYDLADPSFDVILTARIKALLMNTDIKKPRKLTMAYLLGTPVDTKNFVPNMNTINHVCLLYSKNDMIQKVGGIYERRLPPHSHRANLKTTINLHAPGHSDLHDPIVAMWLLTIPQIDNFHWGLNGSIDFSQDTKPTYLPLAIEA